METSTADLPAPSALDATAEHEPDLPGSYWSSRAGPKLHNQDALAMQILMAPCFAPKAS